MTDIWCFTCSHELRQGITGFTHLDRDDTAGCPCVKDGEECHP